MTLSSLVVSINLDSALIASGAFVAEVWREARCRLAGCQGLMGVPTTFSWQLDCAAHFCISASSNSHSTFSNAGKPVFQLLVVVFL